MINFTLVADRACVMLTQVANIVVLKPSIIGKISPMGFGGSLKAPTANGTGLLDPGGLHINESSLVLGCMCFVLTLDPLPSTITILNVRAL